MNISFKNCTLYFTNKANQKNAEQWDNSEAFRIQ